MVVKTGSDWPIRSARSETESLSGPDGPYNRRYQELVKKPPNWSKIRKPA